MKKNNTYKKFNTIKNKIKTGSLILGLLIVSQLQAQETITVFDGVLFYGGYAPLFTEEALYEPIPADIVRHTNSKYARKLTDAELDLIGNTLQVDVTIEAACDNYDRLGHIYVVFGPKGEDTYVPNEVERIEAARFITPFMNKNYSPNSVSYSYTVNNIAEILSNTEIRAEYDLWIELDVFGTTGAGEQQVAGCAGHKDTFRGTLSLTSAEDAGIVYNDEMLFMPLVARQNLNNYNATDVPGQTTKLINFELDEQAENLTLFLITSNHGANSGGEEYVRRRHYVYLNDNLIYQYIPGGKDCEPYRQYNTQGNGIYGAQPMPLRGWIYWNNWCPGDAIPIHEVNLGTLPAGEYTLKVDVPDAEFVDGQGQIPLSAYLHNRESGNEPMCAQPVDFTAYELSDTQIFADWNEIGNAEEWEILYGRIYNSSGQTTYAVLAEETYLTVADDTQGIAEENVTPETVYQIFVRSKCGNDSNSFWSEARYLQTDVLSVSENEMDSFIFYPNPVEDNLFLKSDGNAIDNIAIYDIQGREVLQKRVGGNNTLIDMAHFRSGVYFLKVNISGKFQTYKLEKK